MIDLDLLLYGNQRIATRELRVPHPAIGQRQFLPHEPRELSKDLVGHAPRVEGQGDLA